MDLAYLEVSMLKKIFGVLLIPILMVGVFAGCGKKHTLSDVHKLYTHIVDKYSYAVENNDLKEKDSYFFESVVNSDTEKETTGVSLDIEYKGELAEFLPDIASNSALKTSDPKLYNRYYALIYIEQKLLDWTFNYYKNWAPNMYASEELLKNDLEQEDVDNLYSKLEKLDEAIEAFSAEKSKAEDEIDAISFDGAINLTSFTYYYNDLIEASFDFVNTFRDMHVKYIWDTYTFGDNAEQNKLLLNRMIDEAYLNIAQIIYLENVKAFEYSECDLNPLLSLIDGGDYSQIIVSPLLTSVNKLANGKEAVLKNRSGVVDFYRADDIVLKTDYKYDATSDKYVAETYNDRLVDYIYYLKAFNQKVGIYKKVYSEFDVYEYNQVRLGFSATDMDTYVNSLDRVERANMVLLQDFSNETFANYIENFVKIFNN